MVPSCGTIFSMAIEIPMMLGGGGVIVSPKKPSKQIKFRWEPELIEEIQEIARRTGWSVNKAGAMLMRWGVDHSKVELDQLEQLANNEGAGKKRKQE